MPPRRQAMRYSTARITQVAFNSFSITLFHPCTHSAQTAPTLYSIVHGDLSVAHKRYGLSFVLSSNVTAHVRMCYYPSYAQRWWCFFFLLVWVCMQRSCLIMHYMWRPRILFWHRLLHKLVKKRWLKVVWRTLISLKEHVRRPEMSGPNRAWTHNCLCSFLVPRLVTRRFKGMNPFQLPRWLHNYVRNGLNDYKS